MATSAWSTEAWTDTQQSAGGVTDLTKILWQADWSDLADGTSLNGATGEAYGIDQAGYANVSSVRTLNGRKSARETVGPDDVDGDGAVEYMGFTHTMATSVYGEQGAETWFRIWFYNEAGYVYDTNNGFRKTIRLGERLADGSYSGGYCDLMTIAPDQYYSMPPNTMGFSREGASTTNLKALDPDNTHPMVNERWQCMEIYIKAGTTDATGEMRLWVDGYHVKTLGHQTIVNGEAGGFTRWLYINYWNAGIPKDVTQSWCAPAIAVRNSVRDDTPNLAVDAQGFPFIGTAT